MSGEVPGQRQGKEPVDDFRIVYYQNSHGGIEHGLRQTGVDEDRHEALLMKSTGGGKVRYGIRVPIEQHEQLQEVMAGLEMQVDSTDLLHESDPRAEVWLDDLFESAADQGELAYLASSEKFENSKRIGSVRTIDQPIELPVASIVHVPDMESWDDLKYKDRRHIKRLMGRRIVRKQSDLGSVTGVACVFKQPNGVQFISLLNNGAHTTLAARKRGDATIDFVGDLSFVEIDRDIYPTVIQ